MSEIFKFPNPQTKDKKERKAQRYLEVIPAILTWFTLIGMVVFSIWIPTVVAAFIIAFDIYWIHRTVFISYYSVKAYNKLKRGQKINWLEKCSKIGEPEEYAQEIAKQLVDMKDMLRDLGSRKERKILKKEIAQTNELLQTVQGIDVENVMDWRDVVHVVMLPTATEGAESIDPALASIAASEYPNDKIIILLATEERENKENREKKVNFLLEKYGETFRDFIVTAHKVADGEMKCKASNATYA
ncbi:MAG: hypothetical protein ABFQ53_03765, partial [Patescibacteria group bacterium]